MGARDLPRALSARLLGRAVVLAAIAAASPAAAQNRWPNDASQRAHAQVLFAERAAAFFAAFDAAEPARREAAAEYLAGARSERAPAGAWPVLDDVAAATRRLAGAGDDALARFADTLDLQVVPGAFAPAREGRGEALTVRVYRAGKVEPDGDLRLSLHWIAPDGAETRARTEPIGARAFATPGFQMYVRAPLSEPGVWRLVPEVERDGRTARGVGVEVACVAALEARVAALRGPCRERLGALLELGMRPLAAEGLEALLARCEEGADAATPGFVPAGAAPRTVLAFLALPGEAPGGFLLGPVGARWRELARRAALALVALPPEPDGAALDAALADLGIAERPERVVLVARGVAATTLALQPAATELADAFVETGPFGAPPASLAGAPTLIVRDAEAGAAPAAPARDVTTVPGARTSFLSEPLLPARVEAWLSSPDPATHDR